eukprot:scaffold20587_cov110-Isochrysis_galbana.AAC.6
MMWRNAAMDRPSVGALPGRGSRVYHNLQRAPQHAAEPHTAAQPRLRRDERRDERQRLDADHRRAQRGVARRRASCCGRAKLPATSQNCCQHDQWLRWLRHFASICHHPMTRDLMLLSFLGACGRCVPAPKTSTSTLSCCASQICLGTSETSCAPSERLMP